LTTISLTSELPGPADRVWDAIHDPQALGFVLAPLIRVRPIEPKIFPDRFVPAHYVVGLIGPAGIPLGRQAINMTHPAPEPGEPLPRFLMHDQGSLDLASVWDRQLSIEPIGPWSCRLKDQLTVEAGWRTPILALWGRIYLRLWHAGLRKLAAHNFRY